MDRQITNKTLPTVLPKQEIKPEAARRKLPFAALAERGDEEKRVLGRLPLTFWFLALFMGIAAEMSSPSIVRGDWMSDLCNKAAQRYDYLLKTKTRVSPERVADTYVAAFLVSGAERDAQNIWRDFVYREGLSVEAAIEKHFERVRRLEGEVPVARREEARKGVSALATTHELIAAFESARIDGDFVAEAMERGWSEQSWDAPHPVSYYIQKIRDAAKAYEKSGLNVEDAAVRAGVDTRALWDYHRGVPRSAIITKKDPCYKDELQKFEQSMRSEALRLAMGGLTEEEASKFSKKSHPEGMSRLLYYTQYIFGRHYFRDRIKAWAIAAGDMKPESFKRGK